MAGFGWKAGSSVFHPRFCIGPVAHTGAWGRSRVTSMLRSTGVTARERPLGWAGMRRGECTGRAGASVSSLLNTIRVGRGQAWFLHHHCPSPQRHVTFKHGALPHPKVLRTGEGLKIATRLKRISVGIPACGRNPPFPPPTRRGGAAGVRQRHRHVRRPELLPVRQPQRQRGLHAGAVGRLGRLPARPGRPPPPTNPSRALLRKGVGWDCRGEAPPVPQPQCMCPDAEPDSPAARDPWRGQAATAPTLCVCHATGKHWPPSFLVHRGWGSRDQLRFFFA